ncbi:MAG: hypothetical protein K1X88_03760 [Nannocystaceae bacterium]|nr:hypothetical protein [Nannocystaceae bacterium]
MGKSSSWVVVAAGIFAACGDGDGAGTAGADTSSGIATDASSSSSSSSSGGTSGEASSSTDATSATSTDASTGADVEPPGCDTLPGFLADFKAAHPDGWDINAMSPAEIAGDPDAQALLALCGMDQRPVIPALAWEYGGADHPWISPESSALFYCVYTPVDPGTAHWSFDEAMQLVSADVTIGCPEQNPCAALPGADAVLMCVGDESNLEILVDTASRDDGHGAGLELAEAATDLFLLQDDGTRVSLWHDA